ncbi:MAG TPA: hypothetical protein VIW29_21745 [Polyangiaceae bacterium]
MNRNLRGLTSMQLKRLLSIGGVVLAGSLATGLAVRARAAGIPAANALTYTGYLETPDGTPVSDGVSVTVNVWDALTNGTKVCAASAASVTPIAGRFQVPLPDCQAAVGESADLWLEAVIDGTSLGRTKVGAVPYAVEAHHAVEADHAAAADAAGTGSALATQLTALQTGQTALKARADAPLALNLKGSQPETVSITALNWAWVSGAAPTKLAPGRYVVMNTARAWSADTGCTTNCTLSLVLAVSCMRVGGVLTASDVGLVAVEPAKATYSLPMATVGSFDITTETANVELGLCARRYQLGSGYDAFVSNAYTLVMAQAK